MPLALAGDPVLYADNADEAVHRAGADASRSVWELTPVRITEKLTGGLPRAVGHAQPAPCAAVPATNASVREAVMRAEGRVSYQQWTQVADELGAASSALTCLSEPAEASLAARLFFLQGIAAVATGKNDAAVAAFTNAMFFQTSLVWDESFPPDFRGPYDQAAAAVSKLPMGTVVVGPGVEGATTLWIDGRLVQLTGTTLSLPAGFHLVQILQPTVATLPVRVSAENPVALLVPLQTPDKLVGLAGDTSRQPLLDAIIDQTLSDAKTVYVWTGSRTWKVAETWEELPVAKSVSDAGKKKVGGTLRTAGIVAAGIGAASLAAGFVMWDGNNAADGVETAEDYAARTQAAGAGSALFSSGLVSMGVGALAVGISIPLGGK